MQFPRRAYGLLPNPFLRRLRAPKETRRHWQASDLDHLSKQKCSENLAWIRSSNTMPEILLKSRLHKIGCRYRVCPKNFPGKPDLVFPSKWKVIIVQGCFSHRHGCKRSATHKSNVDYWLQKIRKNAFRGRKNRRHLKVQGWCVFHVWECRQTGEPEREINRSAIFLESN